MKPVQQPQQKRRCSGNTNIVNQAKAEGRMASSGGQANPASPVATTPKIAVDRGVRVRELKCALCGGPFTDADIETVNGQTSAAPHLF